MPPAPAPKNDSPRYDEKTAQEAIALATRLQEEHRERMSREQVEAVAAEVDVEPEFVRQALRQVEAQNTPAPPEEPDTPQTPSSLLDLAAKIWWSVGWMLPALAAIISDGMRGVSDVVVPIFGLIYVGIGILLGTLRSHARKEARRQRRVVVRPTQTRTVSREELLETLFTLQSQLEQEKTTRAFLSIDVVGSSEMKQAASELASEYSFGQYRRWVEQQVQARGGQMQSAAGDGIMSVFSDEETALSVANGLLADLPRFNREQNRLAAPFRIRCGVNVGAVATDAGTPIGNWQSPVIDRAASLQKQAEPNTVVVGQQA